MNHPRLANLRVQRIVVAVAFILLAAKMYAYLITGSVAILTDALESIVNIAASLVGLYSLYIASKPSDQNHPYGHGKAEFLSAAVEGTLIGVAGIVIIYKATMTIINPTPLQKLDLGILLISVTAIINFIMGTASVRAGKKNNSLALIASGRHLQSDTYSTLGLVAGLVVIYYTNIGWLDSAIAIAFAVIIMITSYRILRKSIAGIMDETDAVLVAKIVRMLNEHRTENWVDLHNLRIIKFGGHLHLDCHLTVPWYLNVNEAHVEIDSLRNMLTNNFEEIEIFVHSDGCLYSQCSICNKSNCPVRKHPFERRINWTVKNVQLNKKHAMIE